MKRKNSKSEPADPRKESIGRWISVLYRHSNIYIDKELVEFGIGSSQVRFLMILNFEDGISQEALTETLVVDKATTTRAINRLEKKGYVARRTDENDRRAYRVYLTDKAKKTIPLIRKKLGKWTEILMTDFSDKERQLMLKYLKRMSVNASSYIEK